MYAWLQSVAPRMEEGPSWQLSEYVLNEGTMYE
jgi:hypothetical protein